MVCVFVCVAGGGWRAEKGKREAKRETISFIATSIKSEPGQIWEPRTPSESPPCVAEVQIIKPSSVVISDRLERNQMESKTVWA